MSAFALLSLGMVIGCVLTIVASAFYVYGIATLWELRQRRSDTGRPYWFDRQ